MCSPLSPLLPQNKTRTQAREHWYSKSVDLANEGKYQEALKAADDALALNATSINHLIQANRAGILVMLGRYEDAITAADSALSVSGNLTTTHSIAYYNKGDALRHLGRTDEARDMFNKAQALDPTLIPPDMSVPVTPVVPVTQAVPVTTKSPLSPVVAIAGICRRLCILFTSPFKKLIFLIIVWNTTLMTNRNLKRGGDWSIKELDVFTLFEKTQDV